MKIIKITRLSVILLFILCIFTSCTKRTTGNYYYRSISLGDEEEAIKFVIVEISSKEIPNLKMNESVLDKNHIYLKMVITSGDDIFINGNNIFYKITILESKFLKGKDNNYQRIKEVFE